MTITPEELAAFADGELEGDRAARVAAAIAEDPELRRQVEKHQALRRSLAAHFAPILEQPVPARLQDSLLEASFDRLEGQTHAGTVVDFSAARESRAKPPVWKAWRWREAAIAASLILGLGWLTVDGAVTPREGYADPALAGVLDETLVASQPGGQRQRVLLSFYNSEREICRAFLAPSQSGIACRDNTGWRLDMTAPGHKGSAAEYRMANSEMAIVETAQEMAASGALSAEQEAQARSRGWRR